MFYSGQKSQLILWYFDKNEYQVKAVTNGFPEGIPQSSALIMEKENADSNQSRMDSLRATLKAPL
ncbi:MAG: hypothetical protein BM564_12870 [Bacteroidetes bacterium MedPE-SWsnd-G2]|nr:MAG: hypothetical protein BM564_12870 [Bacteroidetes bacterium MedPE-SWsnd-G2]